jgi:metal-sulfur cluster biosynthetic enzyme
MVSRKEKAHRKQVVSVLCNWAEPHGGGDITEPESMRGIEVNEGGEVRIWMKPARPHCPCCLLDLQKLRDALLERKGITAVCIEVVDVPAAQRWTRAINE